MKIIPSHATKNKAPSNKTVMANKLVRRQFLTGDNSQQATIRKKRQFLTVDSARNTDSRAEFLSRRMQAQRSKRTLLAKALLFRLL